MPDFRALVRIPLIERNPLNRYRNLRDERHEIRDGIVLYSEGNEGVDTNFAAVLGLVDPERLFDLARGFFGNSPFAVIVESETASAVEEHVISLGWALDEEETAMVLIEVPGTPEPPEELDIQRVSNEKTYEDYMTVVPGNRSWAPSLAAATDPRVGLFVRLRRRRSDRNVTTHCLSRVC